ncbi:MAG: cation:proton antiporter, partial [Sulfuritalea sp.]|nr:cation:proton antiporter [Sulfuritalea sp.]
MMDHLVQIILLLAVAVTVMVAFQRLHIPSSLGYLLVGLILGPHTAGPTVHVPEFKALAEFGVVFLLFTIGLNYSLPQLHAMRHQILGLGTAQVALTTAIVTALLWLAGMNPVVAFVIGAVFAQSSSTIIARQLAEQGEDATPHGRLGMAISVFQDVTAVPLLILIPVLGAASGMGGLAGELAWAMAKAMLAFALVFYAARWALRPFFHMVAARRSAELFTLTVLLVVLAAAWTTHSLGLSLAFGAFLAGMMLGETEFRHQVESSIRPFRDVLLGLFFVGIG